MLKKTLYLDTSVASARVDPRWSERMKATQRFWVETLPSFEVYVSEVVIIEAARTPTPARRDEILLGIQGLPNLDVTTAVDTLAQVFIAANLVPKRKREDAMHLALAVHHGIDYLVSWNFDHMVHVKTKSRLPVLAAEHRYFKHPMIVSPQEFLEDSDA